ncbi:MAG: hypothetical protein HQL58_08920 [Magnetococcales bacterium]|nr:hypothetical protein [Magnetococcales bacterium]
MKTDHPTPPIRAGFTLLEVVIMISVMGIIMGVGTPVLIAGYQSFLLGTAIQDADARARLAIERMLRELRTASTASLPAAGTRSTLTFTNQDGSSITYTFSAGLSQLTRGGVVLAENVTGSFVVTDNPDRTTTNPNTLVVINLTITVSGQSIQLVSGVVARNP